MVSQIDRPPRDTARKPGHELRAVGLAVSVGVVAGIVWLGVLWGMVAMSVHNTPVPPIYEVAARFGVSPYNLSRGRQTFVSSCGVCHGASAMGVPRLGKPLRNNGFIQGLSDADLAHFISQGRLPTDPENTTGVAMPARGGNPKISDAILSDVVVYLRTLQDLTKPPTSMDEWIIASGQTLGGEGSTLGGAGHEAFISSCSACHGPGGEGLPNLGKALATSKFVGEHTDEELMKFVKQGRPIWDAENTTGIDMPPKGGNPALSDEQLQEIIAYIRTLHKESDAQ